MREAYMGLLEKIYINLSYSFFFMYLIVTFISSSCYHPTYNIATVTKLGMAKASKHFEQQLSRPIRTWNV